MCWCKAARLRPSSACKPNLYAPIEGEIDSQIHLSGHLLPLRHPYNLNCSEGHSDANPLFDKPTWQALQMAVPEPENADRTLALCQKHIEVGNLRMLSWAQFHSMCVYVCILHTNACAGLVFKSLRFHYIYMYVCLSFCSSLSLSRYLSLHLLSRCISSGRVLGVIVMGGGTAVFSILLGKRPRERHGKLRNGKLRNYKLYFERRGKMWEAGNDDHQETASLLSHVKHLCSKERKGIAASPLLLLLLQVSC